MEDEWTTVISGDRLVKFTYFDFPTGAAFMTAQIAGHEVVYSIISAQAEHPFSRAGVEGRFALSCGPFQTDPLPRAGRALLVSAHPVA